MILYVRYIDSSSNRNAIHTYATVKEYFLFRIFNRWYAILYLHIAQFTIETKVFYYLRCVMIFFLKLKKYDFFWRRLNGRQIKHSYILIAKILYTFLALHVSLS